jgi:hypothetical protein
LHIKIKVLNNLTVKYRKLSKDELNEFEKEFINFLVVNGVTADDWVNIKANQKEKAEGIIHKFSDVIFESILRKTNYLEFISPKSIKCFQCLKDDIVLIGIDAPNDSKIDFTKKINEDFGDLEVYTSTKKYKKQRELEMFDLINAGAQISDGKLYKKLCLIL